MPSSLAPSYRLKIGRLEPASVPRIKGRTHGDAIADFSAENLEALVAESFNDGDWLG